MRARRNPIKVNKSIPSGVLVYNYVEIGLLGWGRYSIKLRNNMNSIIKIYPVSLGNGK